MCVIFYMHQTSGVCAGVCACDRMHQMEKTAIPHKWYQNMSGFAVARMLLLTGSSKNIFSIAVTIF